MRRMISFRDFDWLLLVFVLLVIVAGRVIVAWSRRHAE